MPLWAGRLGLVYGSDLASLKGIRQVKFSHTFRSTQVAFDDPNLVSSAGLVPMLALAERAGLRSLADAQLSLPTDKGANPGLKVGPASTSASALLRYSEVSGGIATQRRNQSVSAKYPSTFTPTVWMRRHTKVTTTRWASSRPAPRSRIRYGSQGGYSIG